MLDGDANRGEEPGQPHKHDRNQGRRVTPTHRVLTAVDAALSPAPPPRCNATGGGGTRSTSTDTDNDGVAEKRNLLQGRGASPDLEQQRAASSSDGNGSTAPTTPPLRHGEVGCEGTTRRTAARLPDDTQGFSSQPRRARPINFKPSSTAPSTPRTFDETAGGLPPHGRHADTQGAWAESAGGRSPPLTATAAGTFSAAPECRRSRATCCRRAVGAGAPGPSRQTGPPGSTTLPGSEFITRQTLSPGNMVTAPDGTFPLGHVPRQPGRRMDAKGSIPRKKSTYGVEK